MKLINLYELEDEVDDFEGFKEELKAHGTFVEGPNVFYVNAERVVEARPELAAAVEQAEDWSGKMMKDF